MALDAVIYQGLVWQYRGTTILAQIVGHDNVMIDQAAVAKVEYRVYNEKTKVATVATTQVEINQCIYDTPQNDSRWDGTAPGYNFKLEVPPEAFPDFDVKYLISVKFTPSTSGTPYGAVFRAKTQETGFS